MAAITVLTMMEQIVFFNQCFYVVRIQFELVFHISFPIFNRLDDAKVFLFRIVWMEFLSVSRQYGRVSPEGYSQTREKKNICILISRYNSPEIIHSLTLCSRFDLTFAYNQTYSCSSFQLKYKIALHLGTTDWEKTTNNC